MKIYIDGACSGNPGPGGWGVFIMDAENGDGELCGYELSTTNNRMEIMAAIKALSLFSEKTTLTVHTDSQYLKKGITEWIHGWLKNGWKSSAGSPVKNQDLWMELHKLVTRHSIEWKWVKAHDGIFGNERADALARNAIVRARIG